MKHLIHILLLFVGISASAQYFNPDKPMIKPFEINVKTINNEMHDTHGHDMLYQDAGFVFIPNTYYVHNGKSLGIIIVHTWNETFLAFDARCPHCFYDNDEPNGKIVISGYTFGKCNKCSAMVEQMVTLGRGQLTTYDHGTRGPHYLETYRCEKIMDRNKVVGLRIVNTPNGIYDEWKQQPENQILLKP